MPGLWLVQQQQQGGVKWLQFVVALSRINHPMRMAFLPVVSAAAADDVVSVCYAVVAVAAAVVAVVAVVAVATAISLPC